MGRALALALVVAAALAAPALRRRRQDSRVTSFRSSRLSRALAKAEATQIFLSDPKVESWLARYPRKGRVTEATYKDGTLDGEGLVGRGRRDRRRAASTTTAER